MSVPMPGSWIKPKSVTSSQEKEVSKSSGKPSRPKSSKGRSSRETSGNTDHGRQKTKPSKTSQERTSTEIGTSEVSKKEYVRPEHLTNRPLMDNEKLKALKAHMEKPVLNPEAAEEVSRVLGQIADAARHGAEEIRKTREFLQKNMKEKN